MTSDNTPTQWSGPGWSVHLDTTTSGITVRTERALDAAGARELSTALHHAAWTDDGEVTPEDWTHALLVAVLMRAGGSVELDLDQLQPDMLGDPAGRHYAFTVEPTGTSLRVSVAPAPEG
uniref:hypothetical protein n=1 Tax=Amycolatopsis sp. CA-290885 TaxID=3239925 RepID=UPI003F49A104